MARRCKDCDPNKYIEGLAYRGANGVSFDNYSVFLDVGQPFDGNGNPTTDMNADVSRMLNAYNPLFTRNSTKGLQTTTSPIIGRIRGVDRANGFWLIWSLSDGLMGYGTPGVKATPANIDYYLQNGSSITSGNRSVATFRKGQRLKVEFVTDRLPSDIDISGFDNLFGSGTSDIIRPVVWDNSTDLPSTVYNSPISNINTLYKRSGNLVGYFTGYVQSIINGSRYVTVGSGKNKKSVLETFRARRSLTIKMQSSDGYDPIQVTSFPGLAMFKGQAVNYQITTNHATADFTAIPTRATTDILNRLGLTWNSTNKTITGNLSGSIPAKIQTATLTFVLNGSDSGSGNTQTFNLYILYGSQDTKVVMPTASNSSFNGTVGKAFNETIRGLNGKQSILAITNLPAGLTFNSSNGKITGTPKHAGVFTCYAAAVNGRGRATSTITLNIIDFLDKDPSDGGVFPNEISLPQAPYDTVKNNFFKFKFYTTPGGDDIIQYKKIDRSEFPVIFKNGKPDGTIYSGQNISESTVGRDNIKFYPGRGKDAQTCFWIQINDPTKAGTKKGEFDINITAEYEIGDATAGLADQTGRICFSPDGTNGPVSSPYSQSLSVTCTNVIRDAYSANPAENEPAVSISPSFVEYQIVYLTPRDGGVLESSSAFASTRLPVSGLLKFPNGIPAGRGTYPFYVFFTDICAFNNSTTAFTSYLETYRSPVRGDVYQCTVQGTCFAKGTKILTPDGYKNIEDLKVNDFVYGYDKKLDLYPCKILDFYDHNKEPQPVFQVTLDNGKVLNVTKSHPFLNPQGDFTFLKDLNVGDYVVSFKNKSIKILDIKFIGFDVVYNLEVEDLHTYIAEDIFVHNGGASRGPRVGQVQCGKWGCQVWNGKRWVSKGRVTTYQNMTLDRDYASVNDLPGNCRTLIARGGGTQSITNYGFQYRNTLLESKDIGITSLTNISILDVLSEGPIEGIVDYEISPKFNNASGVYDPPKKGDTGWKNGVSINKYAQGHQHGYLRSIYWNEIPLADQFFPNAGSLNFEFIRLSRDYGDSAPRHLNLSEHQNIFIEEEFYSKKILNGQKIESLAIKNANTNQIYGNKIKFPRRLTQTKTVSSKLFGKRKFQDGTEKTYKKSLTVMTKDLYGLKLHLKAISLSKTIIDLTIWESFDAAENNSTAGRIDRQSLTFNLTLKRIDKGSGTDGLTYTIVQVPDHKGVYRDSRQVIMTGKLVNGSFSETFEWSGLTFTPRTGFNDNTVGWEIEVEPTYLESVDTNVVLKSSIDSVTEIYNDFLVLPHTAGIMTTFDARFFQSIPQRSYDTRLLKVKIPENYDPYSKTYNGIWNGNFKLGWTDNPAWCFYDILTNKRYGLGKYVEPELTDKWTLYEISKYCDQLVSDGKGFLEPRFTCNTLIATKEDAYKVINDMASIFRAIVYYNAGVITTSQDAPKDPIYIFNNTNVKDGEFIYSNTSKRVRRNVALVRYNNKDNLFKPAVKYTESREGLIRFGIKEIEVSAFGCTSEGQAERLGKWTLLSENRESELVSFETSLPALYLKPGDIVLVQDQNRQNKILAGRTFNLSKNEAVIDVKFEDFSGYLPVIKKCNLNILTPAGNVEVGTDQGNEIINFTGNIPPFFIKEGKDNVLVSGITSQIIRRKQIQTLSLEAETDQDLGLFFSLETGQNFAGFTKVIFPSPLDDTEHTLLKNTVWTIEIDPTKYDYSKSPSVSGFNSSGAYPGAYLEPYLDQTQKFRVLDIEEQEEHRYKITALQYDELKFELGDDI